MALWAAWFWAAEVPIFARSIDARLETRSAPYPVAAQVAGRVIEWHVEVGQAVHPGDLLFRLESELEQRRLDEERARLDGSQAELEALERMLASSLAVVDEDAAARRAAVDEARARERASEAAAALASDELERQERLFGERLISEREVRQARVLAEERTAELEASRRAVERLERAVVRERGDRLTASEGIERELAELRGQVTASEAAVRRLETEIRQHQVTAPMEGTVAEVVRAQAGIVVEAGTRLATILPVSEVEVVALFDPASAVARVRAGQAGQLRLDGFPWSEYGFVEVEVHRVANEVRDGRLRVHATIRPDPASQIPLQHGMPGLLEVEVERVAPAELVWRSAGRLLDGNSRGVVEGPAS